MMKQICFFKVFSALTIMFAQSSTLLSMVPSRPIQQQKMFPTRIYEQAVTDTKTGYLDKKKAIQRFEIEVQQTVQENAKIPKKDKSIFRVMTYNVHLWKSPDASTAPLQEMIDIIQKINPDLVILQEVSPAPGFGKKGPLKGSSPIQKLENIGFNNVIGCNTLAEPRWFGNVVASKVPLIQSDTFTFVNQTHKHEKRCFISAQVRMPNQQQLYLYGAHLEVIGSDEIREQQIQEMLDKIKYQKDKNILIAADFNATRDTTPIKLLQDNGFKDCFTYLGWEHPTYTNWTGKEIDFIFLSPQWNFPLAGCYMYYDATSDHLPIIMDIKLDTDRSSTLLEKASEGILSSNHKTRQRSLELFRKLFEKRIGFAQAEQVVKQALQSSDNEVKFTAKQLEALIKKYAGPRAAL